MSKGPFIYTQIKSLEGKPKVGTKQCVALVKKYTPFVGATSTWREGSKVKGNTKIAAGTAIATFVNGVYPNKSSGNHAAYYISQSGSGIRIMDQWSNDKNKPTISSRSIRFKGQNSNDSYITPSNNGDAFSVIIHEK